MGRHEFSQQQKDFGTVLLILMAVLRLELCKGWKGELAPSVWFWKKVEFDAFNRAEY